MNVKKRVKAIVLMLLFVNCSMEKNDIIRFRDKEQRNKAALKWMQDNSIKLSHLSIFESKFEYHLYVRYINK